MALEGSAAKPRGYLSSLLKRRCFLTFFRIGRALFIFFLENLNFFGIHSNHLLVLSDYGWTWSLLSVCVLLAYTFHLFVSLG